MFILILSLIILASILLVLVILAQNSKGGGLSSQFGGSGASNMIGVQKTGDLLERLTWGLIIVIFALSMSTNFLGGAQGPTDEFIDRAQESQSAPAPALDLGIGNDQENAMPLNEETAPAAEGEANGLGDDLSGEGAEEN